MEDPVTLRADQPAIELRAVIGADVNVFLAQQADVEAARMAAFPVRDRATHFAHWDRILADATLGKQTIVCEGRVAGNVVSFTLGADRLVGYWLGREFWGRGIATRALAAYLAIEPTRPLHARVAKHNVASRRVLEKCGFVVVGEERSSAHPGEPPVDEWIFRYDLPARLAAFRDLHRGGCFVIPNPWDAGSARALESLGFRALATTSSGFAWTLGVGDNRVTLEQALEHFRTLAAAVTVPVNADFEGGFAASPDGVRANVARAVATGVCGLSIEDSTGNPAAPLHDFALAVERVRAAREAIDASGTGVLLTGRSEGFIVGRPDMDETLRRLVAYAEAGAECLYAPGLRAASDFRRVVDAVAPVPVNALVNSDFATVAELAAVGVRRISVGGALARAAWTGFLAAAREIHDAGTFTALGRAISSPQLEPLLLDPPR